MSKVPFEELLNEKLMHEERIFKLKKVTQKSPTEFSIDFLVNALDYDRLLNDFLKNKVSEIVKNLLPEKVKYKINYIKTITEKDVIIRELNKIIYEKAPTVYDNFLSSETDVVLDNPEIITIRIKAEQYLCDYFINSNLTTEVEQYLNTCFMQDSEIIFDAVPNTEELIQRNVKYDDLSIRTIDIALKKTYIGTICNSPRYIIDIKDKENPNLTVCGVVSCVEIKEIPKLNKNLYSFILNDTTSTIKVKCFAKNEKKIDKKTVVYLDKEVFFEGNSLAVSGNYKYDKFDNKLVLMANAIAKCDITLSSVDIKSNFHTVNATYMTIFPKKFEDVEQVDLFNDNSNINMDLINKKYVVFDLETTGLDTNNDSIIEIGAVKVENGIITETFESLINPEMPIPENASKVNKITDDMVEGCPTLEKVLPDFFKFTRDTVLVGHNAANFDIPMLTNQAFKLRYDFDNPYMDSMVLASKVFGGNRISLGILSKRLGVSLEGAHRALNDTIATAKVFIKLMNMRNK